MCLDKLTVRVEKLNAQRLDIKYSSAVDNFTATAILRQADNKSVLTAEEILINYEKQTWKLTQRKELKKFAAFIADDFTGFYPDAEKVTKAQLMQSLGATELKEYELTDFKVKMLTKDSAIFTYKASS